MGPLRKVTAYRYTAAPQVKGAMRVETLASCGHQQAFRVHTRLRHRRRCSECPPIPGKPPAHVL
jgi:hypothetical protein